MLAYDAYRLHVALRSHFTNKHYDYFKYGGQIRVSVKQFEQRNDQYFYTKLAKVRDLREFLVANMMYGDPGTWVGDLVNNEQSMRYFREFIKVRDSFAYSFTQELESLDDDVRKNFTIVDGQHPLMLQLLLRNQMHPETFVVLDSFWKIIPKWNREIADPVVWPSLSFKLERYRPFVQYDREKFMQIALARFRGA